MNGFQIEIRELVLVNVGQPFVLIEIGRSTLDIHVAGAGIQVSPVRTLIVLLHIIINVILLLVIQHLSGLLQLLLARPVVRNVRNMLKASLHLCRQHLI